MKSKWIIAVVAFALAMMLLFARLGHYALWDDEAYTALGGIAVRHTGDTSAVIDHNIIAFYYGELLKNLRDRVTPPLPAYLVAPFVGIGGRSALAARLPFALCGAALIGLALWTVARRTQGLIPILLTSLTILSGVSMFLYFRQARYYAITMLATAMLFYSYAWMRGARRAIAVLVWSLVLLASNYIPFAAAGVAIGLDYLAFGRRDRRFTLRELLIFFILLALIGTPLVMTWNPLGVESLQSKSDHPIHDRLIIMAWFYRDFARAESAACAIILAGVGVGWWLRDWLLLRGILALVIFLTVVGIFSPQLVAVTFFADVRYACAIIPVALAVQLRVLLDVAKLNRIVAVALGLIALTSNALTLAQLTGESWRSTTLGFARELLHPPTEPFTPTIAWINQNVRTGQSIWVVPREMTYPLMFHAPQAIYAWQLRHNASANKQFENLPAIHFEFGNPPDWIIAFGPSRDFIDSVGPPPGFHYAIVEVLDVFWKDMYRPELFWRSFTPMPRDPSQHEAIYVYKLSRN